MIRQPFLTASLIILFYVCCDAGSRAGTAKISSAAIPFSWGFNDDYFPSPSTTIEITNQNDSTIFLQKGYNPFWGVRAGGLLNYTGHYTASVTFYQDSVSAKKFVEHFDITGEETAIDIVVNLINMRGVQSNELHVTKYFTNKYNVQLERKWNPQNQFDSAKQMLPEYNWTNTFDSTLFGIYRSFSSSSTISWVRNWNIGYMQFQKKDSSGWTNMDCNAPRLNAELKKDQTGTTLKDMALACEHKKFRHGETYRILIQYGINDAVRRLTKATAALEQSFYYEPHVYQVADEFTIN